jgi:hypothetical protein
MMARFSVESFDAPNRGVMLRAAISTIAFLALAANPATARACRYSVRDAGFVELGEAGFRLLISPAPDRENALRGAADDARRTWLADSNIEPALSNEAERAEIERLDSTSTDRDRVRFGLEKPSGGILVLALPLDPSADDREMLRRVSLEILSSTIQRELEANLPSRHAVLLHIEGGDTADDERVSRTLERAVAEFEKERASLPKSSAGTPIVLRIPRANRARERVILSALGIDDGGPEPRVAIVFGRGRVLGAPIAGSEISTSAIAQRLSLIGQSCECDLDRGVLRGTKLPLEWNAATRTRTAQGLGFDPESPAVKSEISRILARGPNAVRALETPRSGSAADDAPFSYEQGERGADPAPSPGRAAFDFDGLLGDEALDALIARATGGVGALRPDERTPPQGSRDASIVSESMESESTERMKERALEIDSVPRSPEDPRVDAIAPVEGIDDPLSADARPRKRLLEAILVLGALVGVASLSIWLLSRSKEPRRP